MLIVPRAPGAGVRKPPREETALGGRTAEPRLYGDLIAADEAREQVREDRVQWRAAIWLRSKRLDKGATRAFMPVFDGL
jgi:hypothetical protein